VVEAPGVRALSRGVTVPAAALSGPDTPLTRRLSAPL